MKNINISTLLTILTLVAALISLLAILRLLIKLRKPNIKLNTEFFEQLDKKFDLGLVTNKVDIIVLADSFRREHFATYDLNRLLEDYLRYLINKASNTEGELKNSYIDRHQKTNQILKTEIEERPYNELPDEERRIFRTINTSIKNGDKNETLNALEDLRIVTSTKNKIFQQSNTLNKLSIPLAIIGLILTIYFGIKSLPADKKDETFPTVNKLNIKDSTKMDTLRIK
jgi:hypothetical protein